MFSGAGRTLLLGLALACVAISFDVARADDKKEAPRIGMSVPLAAPPGATTKIVLRGWKLDQATEVRTLAAGITLKLLNKGKATVPNGQEAKQIGDSQVEVELTIPADLAAPEAMLTVVGPDGESLPYGVLVGGREPIVLEKEGNDGFRQAQVIALGQLVDGQIQSDRDVDAYSVTSTAGRAVVVEVVARRRGSGLDSILTVYDERGRTVASNDDGEGADSRVKFTSRDSGRYYLVVQDAHDRGGPAHPYRLIVREASE